VPIGASAPLSSKLVKGSTLKVYPGAPHVCARRLRTKSTQICSRSAPRNRSALARDGLHFRRARGGPSLVHLRPDARPLPVPGRGLLAELRGRIGAAPGSPCSRRSRRRSRARRRRPRCPARCVDEESPAPRNSRCNRLRNGDNPPIAAEPKRCGVGSRVIGSGFLAHIPATPYLRARAAFLSAQFITASNPNREDQFEVVASRCRAQRYLPVTMLG
jgi:hypothetical protein